MGSSLRSFQGRERVTEMKEVKAEQGEREVGDRV